LGVAWQPPPLGFIKLNFDGSKSSQQAAGGFVIRDWTGRLLQAGACNLGAASILVAEATALRNGLRAAITAGFTNIHIGVIIKSSSKQFKDVSIPPGKSKFWFRIFTFIFNLVLMYVSIISLEKVIGRPTG